jgi:hypothetical protein
MSPPVWTHRDEELWHAYAAAALAGRTVGMGHVGNQVAHETAASDADGMLAEHLRRFPREDPGTIRKGRDGVWRDIVGRPHIVAALDSAPMLNAGVIDVSIDPTTGHMTDVVGNVYRLMGAR